MVKGGGVDSESVDVTRRGTLFFIHRLGVSLSAIRVLAYFRLRNFRWQFFFKEELFVVYLTQLLLTPSDSAVSEDPML